MYWHLYSILCTSQVLLFRFVFVKVPGAVYCGTPLSCQVRLQQTLKQRRVSHSGIWKRRPQWTNSIMPADVACSWGRWITNCHNKRVAGDRVRGWHQLDYRDSVPSDYRKARLPTKRPPPPTQAGETVGEVPLQRIKLDNIF